MSIVRPVGGLLLAVVAIGCGSGPPPVTAPVPPAATAFVHTVARGETLWSLSRRYGVSVEDIVATNKLAAPDRIEVGERLVIPALMGAGNWAWPVPGGVMSSGYGSPRPGHLHRGIDIAADRGDPVLAAWDGLVIYADSGMRDYGRLIIIDHGGGLSSLYAHNSRLLVRRGDLVRRGERIARAGDSGNARGIHLHFEVRRNNRSIDPTPFLVRSRR